MWEALSKMGLIFTWLDYLLGEVNTFRDRQRDSIMEVLTFCVTKYVAKIAIYYLKLKSILTKRKVLIIINTRIKL